jgi:hypothetical protein
VCDHTFLLLNSLALLTQVVVFSDRALVSNTLDAQLAIVAVDLLMDHFVLFIHFVLQMLF